MDPGAIYAVLIAAALIASAALILVIGITRESRACRAPGGPSARRAGAKFEDFVSEIEERSTPQERQELNAARALSAEPRPWARLSSPTPSINGEPTITAIETIVRFSDGSSTSSTVRPA
jgi:hypothetical protein